MPNTKKTESSHKKLNISNSNVKKVPQKNKNVKSNPQHLQKAKMVTKKQNVSPKHSQNSVGQKKDNSKHRQIYAILFCALSILMLFLTIIPGENIWLHTHNFIMGIFGICSYIVPIILFYVTFVLAAERPIKSLKPILIIVTIILLLVSATIYIFTVSKYDDYSIKNELVRLYTGGAQLKSAGLFSAILGVTFVGLIGRTGSKILIVILLFVSIMFITGITLSQLFSLLRKPFLPLIDKIKKGYKKTNIKTVNNKQQKDVFETKENEKEPKKTPNTPMTLSANASDIQSNIKTTLKKKSISIHSFLEVPVEETNKQIFENYKNNISDDKNMNSVSFINDNEEIVFNETYIVNDEDDIENYDDEYEIIYSNSVDEIKNSNNRKKDKVKDNINETINNTKNISKKEDKVVKDLSNLVVDKVIGDDTHTDINEFETDNNIINTYCMPPINILEKSVQPNNGDITNELNINGQILVDTLNSFSVQTRIVNISRGPSVTRYELQPAAGVKISKITSLSDDIAMNLAAVGVRIEAPIPGKSAVGIEVPNKIKSIVKIRELIDNNDFRNAASKLTVALGRDIAGNASYTDLASMPHLLIAGSTGSGKSVCINTILISLLYKATPDEVKILMIDPKVVELGIYNGIPHLLVPVVTDPKKAAGALNWAVSEMLDRYSRFAENNVRDLKGYNKKVEEYNKAIDNENLINLSLFDDENNEEKTTKPKMQKLPQIVIVIDELADLMMAAPNEVEDAICRLAQMARAAGMHLIIATQRPSVDVITGIIKANIPSRIAFAVSSQVDSRTILDGAGAEKLLGRGDMLFSPIGSSKPKRIQGCFVNDTEIENVIEFIKKSQKGEYDINVIEEIEKNTIMDKSTKSSDNAENYDPMIEEAIKCVVDAGQASTSYLQRKLHLGYARAGRLIDEMEEMGIVGPHEGAKPRQVLITYQQWLERNMTNKNLDNNTSSDN